MQKTSFYKRLMSLFLAFIMVIGLLPLSGMMSLAQAAAVTGGTGDPPGSITMNSHSLLGEYTSPVLGKVKPRIYDFKLGDLGVSPGFCVDHSKDILWDLTWSSPQNIKGTKYEVIMPLLAAYSQKWFYSRMLDEQHPEWTVEQKRDQAGIDLGSRSYYYTAHERITASALVQSAAWLAGSGQLTDLSNHDQQLLIAHERNLTVISADGSVPQTDEEVAKWIADSITRYNEGEYGEWEAYVYTPSGGYQPIVTVIPPDDLTTIPKNGWIKIKKTDLSGNALAGATFGIYFDSGCQAGTEAAKFVTTADEWTYFEVSELMDSSTQTFYLKELSAPPGYTANGSSYNVTVNSANNNTKDKAAAVNGGAPIKNGEPKEPSGEVRKVDPDGNGIGPATFHFKSLTNTIDRNIPCDENGTLLLQWDNPSGDNYIAPGEYTVTEKIPPTGYELSTEVQNLRLWLEDKDGDGIEEPYSSGPIVFENKPLHSVLIQKIDKTGKGLPGAVFDVFYDGAKVDSITTGADGTFTYAGTDGKGLKSGTWEFVEVKAPDGYLLPYYRSQSVTISTENDDVLVHTLTFINQDYPELIIQKHARGSEQPLAGAVFEVMIDGTHIGRFGPTGPDGTIMIDYDTYGEFLDPDQESWTVQVREVVAPDGYLIDDPDWQTAELTRGRTLDPFVFTDTKYPEIVIRKSDRETEERLPGTTFEISIDAGASFSLTKQTDENGEIWITYEDYKQFIGEIVWDKGWTVTVTETIMPENYNKDKQAESGDWTITKQLQPGQSLLEFDFTDTHYRDLLIRKYDSTNSWLLADAQFELESISLDDPSTGATIRRNGTTNENGELLFENLPNGVYKLKEIQPPTGYDMPDPHEWEITITSMSDRVIEMDVNNEPREGLTITKHDAITGKPLAGVEFSVRYLGDGNDSSDTTNDPRTYITDSNGVIHIPDIVPGWYEIREVAVPDGYVLDPEPRIIEIINAHDTVHVPFKNYQDTQLIILKKDNQTGLPLAGARFTITTAGGSVISTNLVTGSTGYATLSGLKPGSYVVTEVEAPDGHIIDKTPQTFEIRPGQTEPVFLVFGNDGKTTLIIRKEDEQTRLPVAGAVFKLSKISGEVVKARLETGMDGLVSVPGLEPGDYQIEEIEAPPGYLLAENPIQTIHLDAGETEAVLFRNNKPGGIAILKQDAVSGLPLKDAEFEVTNLDGSLVGRYKTGKDGYIRISDLEAGYYYVQEIKAPDGYLLDSTKHQVKVENFKVTLVELENYENASLVIEKVDAESKVPLAGATFGLYSMSGTQIGDPFVTGSNGKATLTGIEPGWYILKELTAPTGYVLNEEEFRVQIKAKRSNVLLEMSKQHQKEFETKQLGMVKEVLIEEKMHGKDHYYTGHTKEYIKVVLYSEEPLENKIVKVKLRQILDDGYVLAEC